jgi:hypothetical protein
MKPIPKSWGHDLVAAGKAMESMYAMLGDDRQRIRGSRLADAGREWLRRNGSPVVGPEADLATMRIGTVDDSPEMERRVLRAAHLSALSLTVGDGLLGGCRLIIQSAEALTHARVTAKALPQAALAIRTAFDEPIAYAILAESAMETMTRVTDLIRDLAMARHHITAEAVAAAVAKDLADHAEAIGMPKGWSPDKEACRAAS